MTPETIEVMKRYEDLKLQVKDLESEIDMLKPELVAAMPEDTEIKTDRGTFVIQKRRVWQYSQQAQNMDKELKDIKKHEEADGTAVEGFGAPYVVYRENK